VQVRWDRGDTETAGNFFYKKGNENHKLCTGGSMHKRIVSAIKVDNFLG
jgi:nuclear transport factor 2 (NTF2) superfamily protein